MKTKKCKYCMTEIPKKAKICPNCKKKQGGKLKFIIIGIIVIVILFAALSGGGSVSKPDKVEYVAAEDLDKIYTDTSSYLGKYVKFNGKVFNVDKDDNGVYVQVWEDINNSDHNTLVQIDNPNLDIKEGDYISVDGYIAKEKTGTNALGGTISAPYVICEDATILSYIDAVAPTTKEIDINQVVEKDGYSLTLEKIEFSEKETRCYITFKNNGNSDFSLYAYSAVAIQGEKQYDVSYNYDAEYEELQTEIKTGVSTSGIILFDKMDENSPISITVEGCDTTNYDSYDFTFDVNQQ